MIDEIMTLEEFKYSSNGLSYGSGKLIYAVCGKCGYTRTMPMYRYTDTQGMCRKCYPRSEKKVWPEIPDSISKSKYIQQYNLIVDDNYSMVVYLQVWYTGDIHSHSSFELKDKSRKANWHATANVEERKIKKHQYYLDNIEHIKQKAAKWKRDNPEKVAINNSRYSEKKSTWGKPIPINNWFLDSNMHHLHIDGNHKICIFIPAELHIQNPHRNKDDASMDKINSAAFDWYEREPENRLEDYDDVDYETYRDDQLTEEEHQ